MTEEGRVDTGRSLEAACNNLIDIDDISPNGGQDIHQKASQENTTFRHFSERSDTKGNNYLSLNFRAQAIQCPHKSFCKFYGPEMFTLAIKFHPSFVF